MLPAYLDVCPMRYQIMCGAVRLMDCQCVSQVLALLTWRDFGWRLHSRLGVDFRRKGATERRHVYSAQAVFVTLVKFDVMWEVRASSSYLPRATRICYLMQYKHLQSHS